MLLWVTAKKRALLDARRRCERNLGASIKEAGPHQASRIGDIALTCDANGNNLTECKAPLGTTCAELDDPPNTGDEGARTQLRCFVWTEQAWLRAGGRGGRSEAHFLYDSAGEPVAKLGRDANFGVT